MENYERKLKEIVNSNNTPFADIKTLYKYFPELKESEDEKIRKELLEHCINRRDGKQICVDASDYRRWAAWLEKQKEENFIDKNLVKEEAHRIAWECSKHYDPLLSKESWCEMAALDMAYWLEKQDKQNNNEDSNILQRFSFYSYKDEPNILYLSGLYVNEECRNKGIGTKILEAADEVAKSLNCHAIRLKTKKDSNAERLYRTHGYNSLPTEERDEIWFEKQGEKFIPEDINEAALQYVDTCAVDGEVTHDNITEPYWNNHSMMNAYKAGWLEKQGEQKSANSYCQENCKGFQETGKCFADGECDAKRKAEQKPTEWSEENENKKSLSTEETELNSLAFLTELGYTCIPPNEEQKPACSEEDEKILKRIDSLLYSLCQIHGSEYEQLHNWLKSIKPRWKPTEKQLDALMWCIHLGGADHQTLGELYEQLYKL